MRETPIDPQDEKAAIERPPQGPQEGMRVEIMADTGWKGQTGTVVSLFERMGGGGRDVVVALDGSPDRVTFARLSCRILPSENPPAAHHVQPLRDAVFLWLEAWKRQREADDTLKTATERWNAATRAEIDAASVLYKYVSSDGVTRRAVVVREHVVVIGITDGVPSVQRFTKE